MTDWIMTASGRVFYPTTPRIEDVAIEDIAHALAAVNRYQGHTREPYSVAQHSVLVSQRIVMEWQGTLSQSCLATRGLFGLLHDASEAYLGDVPRPLKRLPEFTAFREAEDRLQRVIYTAFGLDPDDEPADLKLVDRRMLRTEQHALMPPPAHGEQRDDVLRFPLLILPWTFTFARDAFLVLFRELQALRADQGGL